MALLASIKSFALVALSLSLNFFATDAAAIASATPQECELSFYNVNNQTCYFDIQTAPLGTFVNCALYKDNNFLNRWSGSSEFQSNNVMPIIFVHTKVPTQGSATEFGADVNFTISLYDGAGEKLIQTVMPPTNYQQSQRLNQAPRMAFPAQSGSYLYGSRALPDNCRTQQGVLFMYNWNVPDTVDANTPYKVLLSTDSYRFYSWSDAFTLAGGPVNSKA